MSYWMGWREHWIFVHITTTPRFEPFVLWLTSSKPGRQPGHHGQEGRLSGSFPLLFWMEAKPEKVAPKQCILLFKPKVLSNIG